MYSASSMAASTWSVAALMMPVLQAWSTGIIKAATLQVLAAMEEAEYMEYCVQTTDLNQRLVAERFPLVEGEVLIPSGPGLGVEIDEAALREFAVA